MRERVENSESVLVWLWEELQSHRSPGQGPLSHPFNFGFCKVFWNTCVLRMETVWGAVTVAVGGGNTGHDSPRHAPSGLHQGAFQLWAHPQSGRHKAWTPQMLQPPGFRWSQDPPRLLDGCHTKSRSNRRDVSLPVQLPGQRRPHLTLLPKPKPGGLFVGVRRLLHLVWAPRGLRGNRGHRWAGMRCWRLSRGPWINQVLLSR